MAETNFKWINRKRATEVAIEYQTKEGVTPEDAVEYILTNFEGKYFENGTEITTKRFENFIQRVTVKKEYKKSAKNIPDFEIKTQYVLDKIEEGELTELQGIMLDFVGRHLVAYEDGHSDLEVKDVAKGTGLTEKQVKGILTHLIKKDLLETTVQPIDDVDDEGGTVKKELTLINMHGDLKEQFED
ncbi:hypothetical protein [Bacillus phage YungSlug]|nr:hypothetical protein [Bacillus phage YungSlug]